MRVFRYLVCAVALAGFAACGGKTTKPKPVAPPTKNVDRMNPCDGTPVNPCSVRIDNPCDGTRVNPCDGVSINPCAGDGGSIVEPGSGRPNPSGPGPARTASSPKGK